MTEQAPTIRPPSVARQVSRWAKRLALIVTLLVLVLAGLAWVALHTHWATQRLIPYLPGVNVTAPDGGLLGEFRARRILIALPRGGWVDLGDAKLSGLSVYLDPAAKWYLGVAAHEVTAQTVAVKWIPNPKPEPTTEPKDLRLPLSIDVDRVHVGRVTSDLWGSEALLDVEGRLRLLQRRHVLDLKRLTLAQWSLRGQAQVLTQGALTVQLALNAAGVYRAHGGAQSMDAQLQAKGPLRQLPVQIAMHASSGGVKQSAEVSAQLSLWSAWPVQSLAVKASGLDLSVIHPHWPLTRLSGSLKLLTNGANLQADVAMKNGQGGRWDEGRIPVRFLKADAKLTRNAALSGTWAQWIRGELAFDADLMGDERSRATLRGRWGVDPAKPKSSVDRVDLSLYAVSLRQLHAAAPALTLGGTLSAQAQAGDQPGLHWAQRTWQLRSDVQGRYRKPEGLGGQELPVEAALGGLWRSGQIQLHELQLVAGQAIARASGQANYGESFQTWQTQLRLQLKDFDPRVWFPWPDAWVGRNALQGSLALQLSSDWQGKVQAQLLESQLDGLPLHARMDASTERSSIQLATQVELAGNQLNADGVLPWRRGEMGRPEWRGEQNWQFKVIGPQLHTLSKLFEPWRIYGLKGSLAADGRFQGQGGLFKTQGQFATHDLNWSIGASRAAFGLAKGDGRWDLATTQLTSPTQLQIALSGFHAGTLHLKDGHLAVSGQANDHRLALTMTGQALRSGREQPDDAHLLQLDLRLSGATHGGLGHLNGWHGQVTAAELKPLHGGGDAWLKTKPFELAWAPVLAGHRLTLGPANLDVLGVPLALGQWAWVTGDAGTESLNGKVQLPAFMLARLLRQVQPQTGWGGDLMVAGEMRVNHTPTSPWVVHAAVGKVSGDLTLSDEEVEGHVTQALGIDRTQVELHAQNGLWVLTQVFEGRVLGRLSGRQSIQTRQAAQLPSAVDLLSGALDIHVDNLRPWAAWVPPGWRLNGRVSAHAEVSGTVGSPQYQGTVLGQSLQLTHALMGVQLTDGRMNLALQGTQATLQEFVARDGRQGGQIKATGQARFDQSPMMSLQLQADHFELLQRIDRRIVVSGQAVAALGESTIDVSGKFKVDEGLFDFSRADAPTIGEDVNVVNGPGKRQGDDDAEGSNGKTERKVLASVEINLGDKLHLKGRGLDTDLTGSVKFTTINSRPKLHGTVRAVNGTYSAYGQKLRIERGGITFTGLVENPRLDILAMRAQSPTAAASDVKVGVAITGTAQDPRITLYSEPAMSETEKLSWLILGREPSGLGGADIGLLQSAAVALLSGEGPSATDNIMGSLGLDELSVKQSDGTARETVVNVGKQLSRRWYVGYERNLNATSGNWQLIYRLAQRFTLRAQTGSDNAVDLIWSWRWD